MSGRPLYFRVNPARKAIGTMTYLVEIPVEGGGRLLVQAAGEAPSELELTTSATGAVVATARESLERALDQLTPAIKALHGRIVAMAPTEAKVEFGLVLSAETGIVVAKGSSEVHFTVTLNWKRPGQAERATD